MKKRAFFKRKTSGNLARERLKMLLMTDRISLSTEVTERIEKDVIRCLSKYLDIDEQGADIQFEKPDYQKGIDVTYICARIPVRSMKRRR